MKDSVLIDKIDMYCPICKRKHKVEEWERTSTSTMLKGKDISYKEKFFRCGNVEFQTKEMMNSNFANMWKAFSEEKKT